MTMTDGKDLLVAQAHVMDTIELNYPQLHYRDRCCLHAILDGLP